ncbi:pyrroline-5-carboxylate reductase [Oceanobacillus chungangensis]|uniref:Pyrroline-5-carboxylate reductase n=1 Tax=Oceanobacillus chungangensis TaxID=1229152 RepID=A0A3D8PNK3_9BACI|nr:pyrroline-5-carboxylate reductase [Oceanobacillus chungangensis]RDW16811.1 pyrroline-5-carboxylate reductase [Oceanobacillus chungangensis]
MDKKIAFLGAGSVAEAIISGMIRSEVVNQEQIIVTNRSNQERLEQMKNDYRVQCTTDKKEAFRYADIVVLAVKPNNVKESLESIKAYLNPNQLIISVIAGVTTESIRTKIGIDAAIVRVMPNTSASIGYSATAITAGKFASEQQVRLVESIFQSIGITTIVEEDDMHIVTAVSGSGPAYVYYLVEAMEKAAIEAGLEKEIAYKLITQTILGAGEMLRQSGETAAGLRRKITSPAGTTEAGIKRLEEKDFQTIVIDSLKRARDRSMELGKN